MESDIQYLPGVGPKRAELLRKELGINTFGDLIRLYPFRYIDRSSIVPVREIRPDMAFIQIRARVIARELYGATGLVSSDIPGSAAGSTGIGMTDDGRVHEACSGDAVKGKKPESGNEIRFNTVKRMRVTVEDGSGRIELVFFKGIKWMYGKLEPGREFIFFGKPTVFNGLVNMVHPEVDNLSEAGGSRMEKGRGAETEGKGARQDAGLTMTGVYPSTEKLKNGGITGRVMNRMQEHALNACLPEIEETLPVWLMKEKGLVPLAFALKNIHFPKDAQSLERAKYRLKFEELLFLQLSLLKQKYIHSRDAHGILMPRVGEAFNRCYDALPFPLTGAQKRVITEIRNDMKSGHQMNRLLQGDVGSGKTMVAVLTALIAVGNGYQACIMAPTEVLAQQHFKNISRYLEPAGVRTALLTGSSRTAEG